MIDWIAMTKMHDALVFDYDGVIADTEPLHWRSWVALLLPFGIELGWDEYCGLGRGASDRQIYEVMRKRAELPDVKEFALLNVDRKRQVREWSIKESPIARQTVELLQSLDGSRVGLVTSSERRDVEPVLRAAKILDRFNAAVYGEDVAEHKPSPAPYLLVAERLDVSRGIAFEDSEPGLASARAAGFEAIKVDRPIDLPQIVARVLR
jgi:beta-phosphoglucomutase